MAEFLTKEQAEALKSHHYKSEGRSLLEEHVLRHFWDYIMRFIPMSWAPNSMTLTGVVFMVIPFCAVFYYNGDAKSGDVPSWPYLGMAFGMFVFQTLDNLDGRQARRTKSSNALGEFFDHGCDTISDACMTLSVIMSLQMGTNLNVLFVYGLCIIQDYGFFWRAHWTGKYVFSDIDVSEVQWIVIVVLIFTGINPKIWHEAVIYGPIDMKLLLTGLAFFIGLFYLGDVLVDAVRIGILNRTNESTKELRRNVVAPMKTLLLNMSLATAARFLTNGLFERYPVAFFLVYVIVMAKISCRLLIANMTKSRMVTFDVSFLSYALLLLSNADYVPAAIHVSQPAAIFIAVVFAGFDFVKYTVCICSQLADLLDVHCLSLEKPKPAKIAKNKNEE